MFPCNKTTQNMFLFYHIQQCLTPTWTSIPSHPYTNSTKVLHPTCNQILACLLWALLVKILTISADARSHIFHQFLVLDRGHPTSGLLPFCCCAKSELGDLQNLPGWWGRSPQAGHYLSQTHVAPVPAPSSFHSTAGQPGQVTTIWWKSFLWKLLSPEHQKSE